MLSFSKWENMVVFKYYNPSILLFLTFTYFIAVFSGLVILQKGTVRINFQPRNSHTSSLFKQNSTLKFQDKTSLENNLFVSKSLYIFITVII